jgi:hypothetical protein
MAAAVGPIQCLAATAFDSRSVVSCLVASRCVTNADFNSYSVRQLQRSAATALSASAFFGWSIRQPQHCQLQRYHSQRRLLQGSTAWQLQLAPIQCLAATAFWQLQRLAATAFDSRSVVSCIVVSRCVTAADFNSDSVREPQISTATSLAIAWQLQLAPIQCLAATAFDSRSVVSCLVVSRCVTAADFNSDSVRQLLLCQLVRSSDGAFVSHSIVSCSVIIRSVDSCRVQQHGSCSWRRFSVWQLQRLAATAFGSYSV